MDAVTCPTLVVRGAQSDVFHDEDAERLAGRFRQGRWVKIEGAGHTVQGDNPAGLLVELRKFLAEVYGLISVVARLMTNASRRSRKSTTTSANASGRSVLMAWPAP